MNVLWSGFAERINSWFLISWLFFTLCLMPQQTKAASGITYTGRIVQHNNTAVTSKNVHFTVTIYDSFGKCWLYNEQRELDLSETEGSFSFDIGSNDSTLVAGSANFNGSTTGPQNLMDLFNNEKSFSALGTANGCTGTFTPNPSDPTAGRVLAIYFSVDGGANQALPLFKINPVPAALQAYSLNGYGTGELLKVSPSVSQATNPNNPLNQAQYDEFWNLITGASMLYLKPGASFAGDVSGSYNALSVDKIKGQALAGTAPTLGQVLKWNGSAWAPAADVTTGSSADADYTTKGIVQFDTDATTSGMVVSAGVARVNAGTGVGQLVQVQAGAKLPALDGSNLTNVTASAVANNSIGSAQIVDGSITNADIASLAWSKLTGTPTTLAGYGVTDAIKNLGTIPGASSGLDAAKPASPALGELYIAVDTGKIYRWDGTSTWAVMATKDGSGITSLNGLTSSTQTFAIGTSGNSPAFSSVTSTHTLNIPLASTAGVTAGLISKTDYDNFNIKLGAVSNTASLAATKVWIGNASGVAQEFALSGDATMTSGGVVTVDKTQTAVASKILQLDASSVAFTKGEDIGGASTGKVSLRYPSTAANTTLTLPSSAGSASQFLQTDGAGNLSWASPSSSLPALASTQVWVGNASGAAAEVSLSGDISSITSAGAVTVNKTTTAQANKLLSLDGSGIATSMGNQLNGTTSGSVTLQAAGATTNYSLTFPAVQGSSGQILSNNGSGVLSWVTPVSSSTGFINGGNSFGANSSLGNNDNFNLDLKTNNTSRMTILNTGNVGIGTTSPGSKLTVVTSATGDGVSVIGNTAGDGAPQFSLAATGTTASGSLGLALASPNWSAISVPNDLVLRTIDAPSGGNLILANQNASGGIFFTTGSSWTNDTAKMTILNGGNVGVGTTNPGQKLSVAGTVESTSGGFKFPDGTTQTTAATGGSSQWTSSGSNIYYNTGSIGIGTSTPNTLIHSYFTGSGYNNIFKSENTTTDTNSGNGFVAQNGSSYISMYNQTYRTTDYTPFNQAVVVRSAGAKLSIGSSDTQPVLFSTNASERMRIDSAGNVGIGTTSPGSTLDMKGTLRLSGSTSGYVGFAPAAAAGSATYTLPTTQGTAGQVLSTDGVAGTPTLSWVTPSGTSQWITTGSDIYYNTGKVGVGTTAPRASLDVQGGAIIGAPTGGDVGAGPVDFSTGNLKYTTNSCGSFALRNMKDGGAYTFVVKGATAATCTFTAYSDNGSTALTMHLAPDNGNTTASKHTVFTFIVLGTDVYMSWIPGY